jgi:hypothetical protein
MSAQITRPIRGIMQIKQTFEYFDRLLRYLDRQALRSTVITGKVSAAE